MSVCGSEGLVWGGKRRMEGCMCEEIKDVCVEGKRMEGCSCKEIKDGRMFMRKRKGK